MFNNPHMTVTVSGGTQEENDQLASCIHQSVINMGFSNVSVPEHLDGSHPTLLSQIRMINPELFDNKIVIQTAPVPVVDSVPQAAIYQQPIQGFVDAVFPQPLFAPMFGYFQNGF